MQEEIWKDIEGYEGLYQVSNYGRVKSLARTRFSKNNTIAPVYERILKKNNSRGYHSVTLFKNGIRKDNKVHRLVGIHFLIDSDYSLQINHINGIKTDNRVGNIEFCTAKENTCHAYKSLGRIHPTRGKFGAEHHASKTIEKICKNNGKLLQSFSSIRDAERLTGIDNSSLSRACMGKQKTAGGFKWRYANG